MLRFRLAIAALAALPLAACGAKSFPVQVKQCDTLLGKDNVQVTARIFNGSPTPVKSARVAIDFYRDFKFARVIGVADFEKGLDPNQTTSIPLTLVTPVTGVGGQAQRCEVVHVDFLDGTTADAPNSGPNQ